MPMGPEHHSTRFHIPGDHRGQGCAPYSHLRESKFSVDQQIVEHQIHHHRNDGGVHGDYRLARFPQGAGISLGNGKWQHPQKHNVQIGPGILQRSPYVPRLAAFVEKHGDQLRIHAHEQGKGRRQDHPAANQLEAERIPDPCIILAAKVLGPKDPSPRYAAKHGQIEYKQQLVGNGHPAHGVRPQPAYHYIIQQTNEICYGVLY